MWTYTTYDELYHHGIKGQKWGKRNYQYEDGSLTEAGRATYGVRKQSQAQKKQIKAEYKAKKKELNKKFWATEEKYDKAKTENIWSIDNRSAKDRLKTHMENEYKRSQEQNKIDQERLNAKREYRTAMGKKRTDTLLMKLSQQSIDHVANQSQAEFNKEYTMQLVNDFMNSVNMAKRDRD